MLQYVRIYANLLTSSPGTWHIGNPCMDSTSLLLCWLDTPKKRPPMPAVPFPGQTTAKQPQPGNHPLPWLQPHNTLSLPPVLCFEQAFWFIIMRITRDLPGEAPVLEEKGMSKKNMLLFQFSMSWEHNIHWMMGPVPHRFGVKCGHGPNQRLVYKVVNK